MILRASKKKEQFTKLLNNILNVIQGKKLKVQKEK